MGVMNVDHSESSVWGNKYRPDTIDECILPTETKNQLKAIVQKGTIGSLLFYSNQGGTGKTTSGRALCLELGYDVMFMNASMQNSIDDVRNQIMGFCSSISLDDKPKALFLDECLSENEFVRVGTVNQWEPVRLGDMSPNELYPIVSFNMDSGEFENDEGYVISDKVDDLYEVELDDGRVVVVNSKHPFVVNDGSTNIEKSILDGLCSGDEVVVM